MLADLLFVYGTLRRGFPHAAARRLAREARYLGPARWRGELHDFGEHPGAVHGDSWVRGDLYRLDDPATLAWLDEYEQLADPPKQPWFVRERTRVETDDGASADAWIYRFTAPGDPTTRVGSGDFVAHRAARRR